MLVDHLFQRLIKKGGLTLSAPGGVVRHYGPDGADAPVHIHFNSMRAARRLFFNPKLSLGEDYMRGALEFPKGSIAEFLELVTENMGAAGAIPFQHQMDWLRARLRWFAQRNPLGLARDHVKHHYDLSGELYDLFLDEDRNYSCAYFERPDMSLEDAQQAKKHLVARKLNLEPGMSVLDIGCGWGGLACTLARDYGAKVTAITLSEKQYAYAKQRARTEGLEDKIDFVFQDYRDTKGRFDRIVSVGMFEQVGTPHYKTFFNSVYDRLAEDGVMLLHSIGRMDGPGTTPAFIRKYIFPGGYVPALSEVLPTIEKTGLWVTDIEILRLHYAETLKHWRARFMDRWDEAAALYDEQFCRMWEFYLASSEMTFRHWGQMVFQIQLSKTVDTLPLSRNYMIDGQGR